MAFYSNPKIVTDGLTLLLDAGSENSYPGSGTTWTDLSGNGYDATLSAEAIGTVSASLDTMAFNSTDQYNILNNFGIKSKKKKKIYEKY